MLLHELLRTKAHIGGTHWNKDIAPYLVGFRGDFALIDLEQTQKALSQVIGFLQNTPKSHILLATKIPGFLIQSHENKAFPLSVLQTWIGGLLTNWKQISRSTSIYFEFRSRYGKIASNFHFPVYQKYHKRFRTLHPQMPDILLVTHPCEFENAILEAHCMKIPVIAFVDTSVPSSLLSSIDYIIPGNIQSPEFLLLSLNLFGISRNLE